MKSRTIRWSFLMVFISILFTQIKCIQMNTDVHQGEDLINKHIFKKEYDQGTSILDQ